MSPLPIPTGDREHDKFIWDAVIGTAVKIYGITSGTFTITGLKTGDLDEIALDALTWVEATVGVANRSSLTVQNQSGNGNVILWRYDDPGASSVGYRIEDGGFRSIVFKGGAASKVYIRMLTGTGTALVEEISPD